MTSLHEAGALLPELLKEERNAQCEQGANQEYEYWNCVSENLFKHADYTTS